MGVETQPFTIQVTGGPVLSAPGHINALQTSAEIFCSVDTNGWVLHWIVTLVAGTPTPAQIVAGKTAIDTDAQVAASGAMTSSGIQGPFLTGPYVAGQSYTYYFAGTDGVDYTNVIGSSFVTISQDGTDPSNPANPPVASGERLVSFFDKTESSDPFGDGT